MNGKYICFTLLDISSNIYIYLFVNAAVRPTATQENIHQMKERNFLCKNCKSGGSRCAEWKERSQILNISKSATINIQEVTRLSGFNPLWKESAEFEISWSFVDFKVKDKVSGDEDIFLNISEARMTKEI